MKEKTNFIEDLFNALKQTPLKTLIITVPEEDELTIQLENDDFIKRVFGEKGMTTVHPDALENGFRGTEYITTEECPILSIQYLGRTIIFRVWRTISKTNT